MPAVRRLKTADDVRNALATVFRRMESGEMDHNTGRALVYCGSAIAAVIKDETLERLEERLAALEASEPQRLRRPA